MSEKRHIARAAGVLGSATILSRIMGMVRDMVVSRLFGAGMATDAFFAAFQIPNMLRRFFAEGALTAAFVPIFSSVLTQRGDEEARRLADVCFTLLTIVMAAVTLIGILFSPWIVGVMFPGFHQIPGKFELTVLLNRVMFPYIFFISLVALCMGILNTLRHFFTPAISTVFLNISMILSALLLRDRFQVPITALAAGVLLGGITQLVLQLPVLWRKGYRLRPWFHFNHPDLRRIALLMLPATFGVGVYYLNITVSAILASMLPQGSVSYLYYAQRLFEFPQGIFTVSVAQAVLPSMSRQASEGNLDGMKDSLQFGLRLTLFVTIPAMVGLMVCATPIMSLIFMGGEFDFTTASRAGQALFYYALGLSFVAATRVLAPAFYALGDTRTPVWTAFAAFVINLCASLLLMKPLLHGGLALATSISAGANMLMLISMLRKRVGLFSLGEVWRTAAVSLAASLPMGMVSFYICRFADWSGKDGRLIKAAVLSSAIIAGVALYLLCARLLKSREVDEALTIVRRRFSRS